MKLGEQLRQGLRATEEQRERELERSRERAHEAFEAIPLVVRQDLGPQLYDRALVQIKEKKRVGGTFIKVDTEKFGDHGRRHCWTKNYIGHDGHELLPAAMRHFRYRTQIELAEYLIERLTKDGFEAYACCYERATFYADVEFHDYGVQVSWR